MDVRGGGGAEHKFSLKGFTLAEVLITLGIIGVVAAMTMPVLIQKYKFLTYEVGLKKQYSVLLNAINYLVVENGLTSCYQTKPYAEISYYVKRDDCLMLENGLVSLLKLKKYNSDIKDKYARKSSIHAGGGDSINWNCSYDEVLHTSNLYVTNDGAFFMFTLAIGTSVVPTAVVIDVNGEKGPNKWGYDVFFMGLNNSGAAQGGSGKILLTDEYCSIIEKGGRYARTILRNEKTNSSNSWYL